MLTSSRANKVPSSLVAISPSGSCHGSEIRSQGGVDHVRFEHLSSSAKTGEEVGALQVRFSSWPRHWGNSRFTEASVVHVQVYTYFLQQASQLRFLLRSPTELLKSRLDQASEFNTYNVSRTTEDRLKINRSVTDGPVKCSATIEFPHLCASPTKSLPNPYHGFRRLARGSEP